MDDGQRIALAADHGATDALADAGVCIDTKRSDGLCGACALPYDSAAERRHKLIACCVRMQQPGAELVLTSL